MKRQHRVLAAALLLVGIGIVAAWWAVDAKPAGSMTRTRAKLPAGPDAARQHLAELESSQPTNGKANLTEQPTQSKEESRAIVVETPSQKLARMTSAMEDLARTEQWDKLYSGLDKSALKAQQSNVEQAIVDATRVYFEHEFQAGRCETLDDRTASTDEPNPFEVQWKRFESGKPAQRCVAPESKFSDAYRLRMLSVWLGRRAFELESTAQR